MKQLEFLQHIATHDCIVAGEGSNRTQLPNSKTGKRTITGRHRELDHLMAR